MVKTAFGDGCILAALIDAGADKALKYKVKLPFGVAYIRPSSIAHHLPSDMECVRRNGFMDLWNSPDNTTENGQATKALPPSCHCVFGTEKMYIFMRLYCILISLLERVKIRLDQKWLDVPYYTKNKRKSTAKNYYNKMIFSLKQYLNREKYLNDDIEFKRFEISCRDLAKERVHEMSALPRLIEKCADTLVKLSRDDKSLTLFDLARLNKKDITSQRHHSLTVADALYRIQYNPDEREMHFSFISKEKNIVTVPRNIAISSPPPGTNDQSSAMMVDGGCQGHERPSFGDNQEPISKRIKLK